MFSRVLFLLPAVIFQCIRALPTNPNVTSPPTPTHRLTTSVHMFNHGGINPVPPSPSSTKHHPQDGVALNSSTSVTSEAQTSVTFPRFAVYSDRFVSGVTGVPDVSSVNGWNTFILSFLLTEGAFDKAEEWTWLTADQRAAALDQYHAAGVNIIVSVFGSTDTPTSSGADPVQLANTMAQWVIEFGVDGVDVDYEDFFAMDNGFAEEWLISFTRQLRVQLPVGQYILTHAPVAPWFSPNRFSGGAYQTVNQEVGSLIDWYNIQFYNQGSTEYTTCTGLLTASSNSWPQSAVFQIASTQNGGAGIPLNKLVIGKPASPSDASNGFIDPATLAGCVAQAKSMGWNGGAMTWEYPDGDSNWIRTVRGQAFPV